MTEFELAGHEYIELHSLLKVTGLCESGGVAKLLIGADYMDQLDTIKVPTLLLSPEASPFIALDLMADMRRRLPNAELQVFAHAKHGLPLSHGAQCAAVARDFLDRPRA